MKVRDSQSHFLPGDAGGSATACFAEWVLASSGPASAAARGGGGRGGGSPLAPPRDTRCENAAVLSHQLGTTLSPSLFPLESLWASSPPLDLPPPTPGWLSFLVVAQLSPSQHPLWRPGKGLMLRNPGALVSMPDTLFTCLFFFLWPGLQAVPSAFQSNIPKAIALLIDSELEM